MTSTKPTPSGSGFRSFLMFLVGLALCIFGVYYSLSRYPGPDNFQRFVEALPTLGAVAAFALGIAAALAGLALLVPSALRMGGRPESQPPPANDPRYPAPDRGVPGRRPMPQRGEEEDYFDPQFDPEGYGGGDYPGSAGGRPHSHPHANGDYDPYEPRRRAGSYR